MFKERHTQVTRKMCWMQKTTPDWKLETKSISTGSYQALASQWGKSYIWWRCYNRNRSGKGMLFFKNSLSCLWFQFTFQSPNYWLSSTSESTWGHGFEHILGRFLWPHHGHPLMDGTCSPTKSQIIKWSYQPYVITL